VSIILKIITLDKIGKCCRTGKMKLYCLDDCLAALELLEHDIIRVCIENGSPGWWRKGREGCCTWVDACPSVSSFLGNFEIWQDRQSIL
jgi:hypothetical protein